MPGKKRVIEDIQKRELTGRSALHQNIARYQAIGKKYKIAELQANQLEEQVDDLFIDTFARRGTQEALDQAEDLFSRWKHRDIIAERLEAEYNKQELEIKKDLGGGAGAWGLRSEFAWDDWVDRDAKMQDRAIERQKDEVWKGPSMQLKPPH